MNVYLVKWVDDKARKLLGTIVFGGGFNVLPEHAAEHIHKFDLFPKAKEITIHESNAQTPHQLIDAVRKGFVPKESRSRSIVVPAISTPKPKIGDSYEVTDRPTPSQAYESARSGVPTPPSRFAASAPSSGPLGQTEPEKTIGQPATPSTIPLASPPNPKTGPTAPSPGTFGGEGA